MHNTKVGVDLAEKVIKELEERGENTALLETLLQSDS